jgi:seryl-tRNA synthetase
MLDIKSIRENVDAVKKRLDRRGPDTSKGLTDLLDKEEERRRALSEVEALKSSKKKLSAEVGKLKQAGGDGRAQMEEVKTINTQIKDLDEKTRNLENEISEIILGIPNLPDDSIPDGVDETANELVRAWGEKPEFSFTPKAHTELGENLDLLDFKRAAKIAGSRFTVFKGHGAQLLRALINFMIDVQTRENGYEELYPPFLVNEESMLGTGQLPKFSEDLFTLKDDPYYLIPTAEVPVTNFHRDEVLKEDALPICYTAYTPCFRREAGSYGKDTAGLIRQHQFDKVEMVKFVHPDESERELESLVENAESILKKLNLHYRVVVLCVGDLGFSAAKTYDLEVWIPSQNTYREISSCSSFTDYQARRAKIRFKKEGEKPAFVHTLNGSGLAAGRLFVAILENFQQENGAIAIPEALAPYMHGLKTIDRKQG